jgi:hypothetical protein
VTGTPSAPCCPTTSSTRSHRPANASGARKAYLEFNRTYPGAWRVGIQRVIGDDRHGASWTGFVIGEDTVPALTFFDFDADGLISHITDFWPEPYAPPAGREHLTERF